MPRKKELKLYIWENQPKEDPEKGKDNIVGLPVYIAVAESAKEARKILRDKIRQECPRFKKEGAACIACAEDADFAEKALIGRPKVISTKYGYYCTRLIWSNKYGYYENYS